MIIFVRHGLDDEKHIGGWSNVDLLEVGKQQVEEVGAFLKEKNISINKIYSSDVKRAETTAKIIQKYIGQEIISSPIFRELNKGDLNGMLLTEANAKYPEYDGFHDIYLEYPNGESMFGFYNRIKKDLYENLDKYDDCVIVTHRGVINMLYFILNNKQVDMDKKQFGVTHGSIHILDTKNKTIEKIK